MVPACVWFTLLFGGLIVRLLSSICILLAAACSRHMSREFWCHVLSCAFCEWHLFEIPAMSHTVFANAFCRLGLKIWSVLGQWGRWRLRLLHPAMRERTRRPGPGAEVVVDLEGSEPILGPMLRRVERRARTAEIPCCCHEAHQHSRPVTFDVGTAGTDGVEMASPRSARSSDSSEIERRMVLRDRAGTPAWALESRRERADRLDRDCSSRRFGANPLDAFLRETESGEEEQPEDDPFAFGNSGDETPPARASTHAEDSQTYASSAHDMGHAETEPSFSPSWPSFDQVDDDLGYEPQAKD